jgi:hypothetical protein
MAMPYTAPKPVLVKFDKSNVHGPKGVCDDSKHLIAIPALGRDFQLGTLYNCNNDSIIAGTISIFENNTFFSYL